MKMKFSDAVLLGSTLLKPMRGVLWVTSSDAGTVEHGCAIGMALKALGRELGPVELLSISLPAFLNQQLPEYPWLVADFTDGDKHCPYHCGLQAESPLSMIIHLFDNHVVGFSTSQIPFSSLIEYIKTVEPEEVDASAEEIKEVEHEIEQCHIAG